MGLILQTIRNNAFCKNASSLINIKLSKLRDFHASFKCICDNFSIDLTQFQHIFGVGQASFVIWDTDNNGLVDSLQLFCGLAIFADMKQQDKLRFMFDLLDFNELESLTTTDITFMFYCCISSSFKIFSISSDINITQINDFVQNLFQKNSRINITELILTLRGNSTVKEFISSISVDHNK